MIDAHAHIDRDPEALAAALQTARSAGVSHVVLGGTHPAHAAAARTAAAHPDVSWTAGLHPWWAPEPAALAAQMDALAALFDDPAAPRPVGLGELGLDHARPASTRAAQAAAFRAQLRLARERDLPIVLHVVRAHGAALDLLESDGIPAAGGFVHGFTGAAELARRYVRLGLHIGVGPHLTRAAAARLTDAVRALSPAHLLVETDSPDQAAGPADVARVVAALAAARGEQPAAVARYTADNATRLFGLGPGARRHP